MSVGPIEHHVVANVGDISVAEHATELTVEPHVLSGAAPDEIQVGGDLDRAIRAIGCEELTCLGEARVAQAKERRASKVLTLKAPVDWDAIGTLEVTIHGAVVEPLKSGG